jgi:hypothetical protein
MPVLPRPRPRQPRRSLKAYLVVLLRCSIYPFLLVGARPVSNTKFCSLHPVASLTRNRWCHSLLTRTPLTAQAGQRHSRDFSLNIPSSNFNLQNLPFPNSNASARRTRRMPAKNSISRLRRLAIYVGHGPFVMWCHSLKSTFSVH